MPVAVALKRLVTARELFAFWFAAFFFLSRLVMLTAGTLTALHRVTAAAGREGSTNACVAQAAKTARRKHRMVCEDLETEEGKRADALIRANKEERSRRTFFFFGKQTRTP